MTNICGNGRIGIGFVVILVIHANPFSPLIFIEQEPQIPSLHDLFYSFLVNYHTYEMLKLDHIDF